MAVAPYGVVVNLDDLRGIHLGERIFITGSGPSLARITLEMVPGPIIAINRSLLSVRGFPVPIYSLQKDGCVPHDIGGWYPDQRVCYGSPCVAGPLFIEPRSPEVLVCSAAESWDCFTDYPARVVVDVEDEFKVPWFTMSAAVAVHLARLMGAASVTMVAHDAHTTGSTDHYMGDGTIVSEPNSGYAPAGQMAEAALVATGLTAEWMTP